MSAERKTAQAAIATIAVIASLTAGNALAQSPSGARDTAAAEALYKTGRELLAKGDWAAACSKFDASFSLDPAASTLLNIAKCHEHDGKLALAWADYKRALVLNQETPGAERQKALADIAQKGIDAIEPRLPKLRIDVSDRPAGLKITRDGQDLPVATLGEALPIDPGAHEVVISAPGFETLRKTVTAEEGAIADLKFKLTPEAAPPPTAAPVTTAAPITTVAPPITTAPVEKPATPPDGSEGGSRGVPLPTWIAGGLGVALIGAGIAFRVDGAGAESNLDANCGPERRCDPAKKYDPADDNARKNRDFGLFVGLTIAGGAAITGAVIGAIFAQGKPAPTKSTAAARVTGGAWAGPGAGGAALRGTF